jgi:hypothetical protein
MGVPNAFAPPIPSPLQQTGELRLEFGCPLVRLKYSAPSRMPAELLNRNEAQTRYELIDPALDGCGWNRGSDVRIETTAGQIDIIDGNVYCIVSLPGGVFTSAGAGVKTNLVFFIKGKQTEKNLVLRFVGHQDRQENAVHTPAL